jgi:hypothetical protein
MATTIPWPMALVVGEHYKVHLLTDLNQSNRTVSFILEPDFDKCLFCDDFI